MNNQIHSLETYLYKSDVRNSREKLEEILADDFIELGASGNIWTKQDLLDSVPLRNIEDAKISDFKVNELSPEIYLATYVVEHTGSKYNRSSIWRISESTQQMVFSQGTKIL